MNAMTIYNESVLKLIGLDFELSNSLTGKSAHEAARLLLHEIPGFPRGANGGTSIEFGRRFVSSSGGSWYIDSDHLEGNLPEHTRAFDHAKILHGAGLRQARMAQVAASNHLPSGSQLNVIANCSDGNTSWGCHLNILVTRQCFEDLSVFKPHLASFLATHLVTSVIYTGGGLVGPANGRSFCNYQLSQRADWFEKLYGQQTMFDRPLINLRDEAHAGPDFARLHIIYYDMVLASTANILKAGTSQLVVAMIEAGWIDLSFCLDDPVAAASLVSRDLSLREKLRTVTRGRLMTAVEIQAALAEMAGEFVGEGLAEGIVPDAVLIVELWQEVIEMLRQRELEQLAKHTDCWLKYLLLERHRRQRNLSWSSAELKVLDSLYASLDPERSLFFEVAANGGIERMPTEEEITNSLNQPPCDSRAYFRAHALRNFGEFVHHINWDNIVFRMPSGRHWSSIGEVRMPDPTRFNRRETKHLFERCGSLEELVEAASPLALDHVTTFDNLFQWQNTTSNE